jgi:hypothetical protein
MRIADAKIISKVEQGSLLIYREKYAIVWIKGFGSGN